MPESSPDSDHNNISLHVQVNLQVVSESPTMRPES